MNVEEINALKGPALHELAAELSIPNRSKMKVQEIRDAILAHYETVENDWIQEGINNSIMVPPSFEQHMERSVENELATNDPGLLFTQSVMSVVGSASPMTSERRTDVYLTKGRVTPKMARRARHKENKARG